MMVTEGDWRVSTADVFSSKTALIRKILRMDKISVETKCSRTLMLLDGAEASHGGGQSATSVTDRNGWERFRSSFDCLAATALLVLFTLGCSSAQEPAGGGVKATENPVAANSGSDAEAKPKRVSPATDAEDATTSGATPAGSGMAVSEQSDPSAEPKAAEDAVPPALTKAVDWPFFRGDWAGRGYVGESKLPEQLEILWEYWEHKTSYESSPVVVGQRVVVADLDGMVRCLDLSDKSLIWKTPTKFGFIASPSIQDGRIFIGDLDGTFRCLRLEDGQIEWEFQANAKIDSAANFHGPNVLFGSQDSYLYCLNQTDGTLVWKHQTDDQIRCSIVVDGERTAVAGCDAMLHVINVSDGSGLAKIEVSSQSASAPAMVGDRAYVGLESGEFICADMKEGKILWTWSDEQREAAIRGCAATNYKVAIFGNRGNRINCLDLETGNPVWQISTKRRIDGSVVIVGDRAYVGDVQGNLLTISVSDGTILQTIELDGGIVGGPCVVGDKLLVATQEGYVYCLGQGN